MRRLLVIKPSSLGDIVHALQVMQPVAEARPDLAIEWVVRDRFAGLVEAAPWVRRTYIFRRKQGAGGLLALMRELRAAGPWDAVFDMQGLLRSGLMTAAARAPRKIGRRDSREGAGLFYRERPPLPPGAGPWHAIDILREFPALLGLLSRASRPLDLTPAARFAWADFMAGDPRARFVVFTDSRGPKKQWPHFDAFTRRLWEAMPEARVAWCAGGRQEPGWGAAEQSAGRFINLTGCPFDEMLALARAPSIFVGNDSGPMHLSAATGNRVLALFGPTPARRFGPYPVDDPHHLAVEAPGGDLSALSPEAVLAALIELRDRAVSSS